MNTSEGFTYRPTDQEAEKASNSYLMTLIAIIAGLPLPIVNLLATLIFYLGNRKGTFYVRWHCMQSLVSQFSVFIINTICFWWTISIVFKDNKATDIYFGYLFTVILFNLAEFIATIYAAIQTRKGKHVYFYFYGGMTDQLCKS